jgi:hypothetical protein
LSDRAAAAGSSIFFNGKRELSKNQARALATLLDVALDLLIR